MLVVSLGSINRITYTSTYSTVAFALDHPSRACLDLGRVRVRVPHDTVLLILAAELSPHVVPPDIGRFW